MIMYAHHNFCAKAMWLKVLQRDRDFSISPCTVEYYTDERDDSKPVKNSIQYSF